MSDGRCAAVTSDKFCGQSRFVLGSHRHTIVQRRYVYTLCTDLDLAARLLDTLKLKLLRAYILALGIHSSTFDSSTFHLTDSQLNSVYDACHRFFA